MRRTRITSAVVLSAALTLLLAFPATETGPLRVPSNLPDVHERATDPELEERGHGKGRKVSLPTSSLTLEASAPAYLHWHRGHDRTVRRDDPSSSLAHGLRAPPA